MTRQPILVTCSAPDLVDFSPVYRCLHIYTVLDERETYERYLILFTKEDVIYPVKVDY
jgi:hypothetical protein